MQLINIDPRAVDYGQRLREVDPDWTAILVESVRRDGIRTPIEVMPADEAGRYLLVTGAHRTSAALEVGLTVIPALLFEGTELQAQLREVEENLVRHELTELDRAAFLAQHKRLYLLLHPDTKQGGDRRRKQTDNDVRLVEHPLAPSFSAAAAAKLGVDERTVRRISNRYEPLAKRPAVLERIKNTWIANNGAAMDDLIGRAEKKLTETEQHAVLDILLEPASKIRRVNEALRHMRRLPPPDEATVQLDRLKRVWKLTKAPARQAFRAFLMGEGN